MLDKSLDSDSPRNPPIEEHARIPTDSGLLNDGARVLTRTMKKIGRKVGGLKKKVRNRMRSVTQRVIAIGYALRRKGTEGEEKRKKEYRELLRLTRQILNDSRRVLQEVEALPPRLQKPVRGLGEGLYAMTEQVRRVVRQTKARIFGGATKFPGKVVSLFEPHTEIIRKGKAGKPNEFGKLVQTARSRKPDCHPLRSVRGTTGRPNVAVARPCDPAAQTGPSTAIDRGRCWFLFPCE